MSIFWQFVLVALAAYAFYFLVAWLRDAATRRRLFGRIADAPLTDLAEALPAPAMATALFRKDGVRRRAAQLLDLTAAGCMTIPVGFKDSKPKQVPGVPRPAFYRWQRHAWEVILDKRPALTERIRARSDELAAILDTDPADGAARASGFDAEAWERLLPQAYAADRVDAWARHFEALGGTPGPLRKRADWAHAWSASEQKRIDSKPKVDLPYDYELERTYVQPEADDFPD